MRMQSLLTFRSPAFWAALLLGFAVSSAGQSSGSGQKKVIRDPAEYNAYITAVNTKDAAARAAALEGFVQQFPHSVVYSDALEEEMAAWQQAGDGAKVKEAAKRLLAADPGNVRALAIVVQLDRASATRGDKPSLDELCLYSTAGMREVPLWQQPDGMDDDDFTTLRRQMNVIFDGAAGYCALQQKNYAQAREWLTRAFQLDGTNLEDITQIAVADLQMTPVDAGGFWYCARAIYLAGNTNNADAASSIASYCRAQYAKYHGAMDGWDAVMTAGSTQDGPPAKFAEGIRPALPAATPK